MLSQEQLAGISNKILTGDQSVHEEAKILVHEVIALQRALAEFTARVNAQLANVEEGMEKLEQENARLRKVTESTYFERDACVGLISKFAMQLGMPVGTGKFEVTQENEGGNRSLQSQNRVVIDLPTGQVSWDFLDDDAHLFSGLPEYKDSLKYENVRDVYMKVMEPGLEQTGSVTSSS